MKTKKPYKNRNPVINMFIFDIGSRPPALAGAFVASNKKIDFQSEVTSVCEYSDVLIPFLLQF